MSAPQPGTPLPWGLIDRSKKDHPTVTVQGVNEETVCFKYAPKAFEAADFAYIAHACNNYPKAQALADALRALRNEAWVNLSGGRGDLIDDASAALAAWDAKP